MWFLGHQFSGQLVVLWLLLGCFGLTLSLLVGSVDTMASQEIKTEETTLDDIEQEMSALDPADLEKLLLKFSHKMPSAASGGLGARPKASAASSAEHDGTSTLDVGHLKLRIPVFSGDNQKGDLTFPQWKYEVSCILEDCKTETDSKNLLHAIRRSLRGTAAELLRYMGSHVSVVDILDAFERRFGNALTITQLCHSFFGASQGAQESLAAWSGRLEDLISQMRSCEDSHIGRHAAQDMLRHQFWTGLYDPELRQATRHKYDNQASYEELFKAVRLVQQEGITRKASDVPCSSFSKKGKAVSAAQSKTLDADAKLDEILKKVDVTHSTIKELQERVTKLESLQSTSLPRPSSPTSQRQPVKCYRCGRRGHVKSRCVAKIHINGQPLQGTNSTSTDVQSLNYNASTPGGRR